MLVSDDKYLSAISMILASAKKSARRRDGAVRVVVVVATRKGKNIGDLHECILKG